MSNSIYQPQLIKEDFVDFVLEQFDPLWSWKKVKAEVIAQQAQSPDMYKITLKTNSRFTGVWQAGQYVLLSVQIDGVYHQRSYSIVGIDDVGQLILGIKAQGKVSNYLCSAKNVYVELSQAQGDFVLHTRQLPALLIASGSGITAIYALAKQAVQQGLKSIHVLYFNRHPVFHVELEQLCKDYPNFSYQFIDTSKQKRHLDENLLNEFCPAWQETQTYVCGASALMKASQEIYQQNNISDHLLMEYFQAAISDDVIEQIVTFRRSQRDFIADKSLLESAEQAGFKPSHGCRMGICSTCTCTKVSGVTKNMLTGEIESEENRPIKLCISQAMSPVVIDL